MKALVTNPLNGVGLIELAEPVLHPDEVLVAPLMVGMCGTDLELIDATIDPAYVRYPLVLGHEWVGELLTTVDGVGSPGDHVVVEGIIPCGVCAECVRGDTNRCATYDEIGFTRPGALAERVAVPASLVHRVEPSVSLDDAVLVEPMAVVWRALTRIPLRRALRVAVIGDGTIALLAAHMVRLFEPASVIVIGRREAQADLARAAGADEFTTLTPHETFDLIIEAAGAPEAVASALSLGARGALVILLGLPAHGTTIDLAPDDIVNNDLIIQGSFSYTRAAWTDVVARLNAGTLHPSFLITHRFTLDAAEDAVATLRGSVAQGEPRGKVVVSL